MALLPRIQQETGPMPNIPCLKMMAYLIYRMMGWIVITFPKRLTYKMAVFIADLFYLFSCRNRKALVENLRHVFPEKEAIIINFYARLTFRNFAKYLVDFFRFDKFDREAMEREVTIEGIEHVQECLKRGQGLITVTAHLGNWELGGVIMALWGYKFNVVALSHGSAKVDELFVRQRANKGVRVIPLGQAASRCLKALKNNELIALLGDRDIDGRGVKVPFFGQEASIPRGPAALSIHTQAPILPGFLVRRREDKFSLILEKALDEVEVTDKEEKIKRLTSGMVKVIEKYIRRYPGQWFMFYPIWKEAR